MGTSADQAQTTDTTTPWPPRYRWLKRSIAIFFISIFLLTALWFWWSRYAHKKLQSEIDAMHARGEQILDEDYPVPQTSDNDSAGIFLRNAHLAIVNSVDPLDLPWTKSAMSQLVRDMAKNKQALLLARQARQHPIKIWGVAPNAPKTQLWINPLPDLNNQRGLCEILLAGVQVEHSNGNDAEAVEILRDVKHQADTMEAFSPPALVVYLTQGGIDATASSYTLWISRDLQITPANHPAPSRTASRAQILVFIGELGDERNLLSIAVKSYAAEKTFALDATQTFPGFGPNWTSIPWNILHPMNELDILHIWQDETLCAQAIASGSWPQANAMLSNGIQKKARHGIDLFTHVLSGIIEPSVSRSVRTYFQVLTMRRAAVISLAIALYRHDHAGQWPQSLSELVPAYLPAIPVDPFSAVGNPIQYKTSSNSGPILYSVGPKGIDGAKFSWTKKIEPQKWEKPDVVFLLTDPPPATQPADSPNAVNNN